MPPVGLIGLCAPDFQGDVAAARASAATGVPNSRCATFSQAPMEDVIKHAGSTPNFFQLYLPGDRELAASFLDRAESSGYSSVVVTPLIPGRWATGLLISRSETVSASAWFLHAELLLRRKLHQTSREATTRRSGGGSALLRVDLRGTAVLGRSSSDTVRKPIFPPSR